MFDNGSYAQATIAQMSDQGQAPSLTAALERMMQDQASNVSDTTSVSATTQSVVVAPGNPSASSNCSSDASPDL